jgi:hypothetical protein
VPYTPATVQSAIRRTTMDIVDVIARKVQGAAG